jgi:hypothetical protein
MLWSRIKHQKLPTCNSERHWCIKQLILGYWSMQNDDSCELFLGKNNLFFFYLIRLTIKKRTIVILFKSPITSNLNYIPIVCQ